MATEQILAESDIEDDGDDAHDLDSEHYQDILEQALREFDEVAVPQKPIREAMRAARRFVTIPGAMYEGPLEEQYENSPKPEFDQITPNMEKIEEDYRQNRVSVSYKVGDDGDPGTAQLLEGLFRADAAHFGADEAIDNAFKDALRGGMGAVRLTTDYADPYDPDSDAQRINPAVKIIDPEFSVYLYGGTRDDGRDATSGFIITADLRSVAEKQWPGRVSDWPVPDNRWQWDWYTPDLVYKAEYYRVEDVDDTLYIFTQAQSGEEQRWFKSEMEAGLSAELKAMGWKRASQARKRKRVRKYLLNGSYILKDCGYIAGRNIPIVLLYGRVDWIDGQPRYRGYVEKRMDAQRSLNSELSRLMEAASLAPYPVPIVAPEQMDSVISAQWAEGNIKRYPYRTLHPLRNEDGSIASAGPIGMIESPQPSASTVQLLQFDMQILQGDQDPTQEVPANTSADAMDIAAGRVDAKSGIYMDNLRSFMQRLGEVYRDAAPDVYFEDDRVLETMSVDNQVGSAKLNDPRIDEAGVYRARHDLSPSQFKVVAAVSESTQTQKQRSMRQLLEVSQIAGQNPQTQGLAAASITIAVMDSDNPQLADYARQLAVGNEWVKPTPEEEQEIQQAEQNKASKPDPQAMVIQAEVAERESKTDLNKAKTLATVAKAHLEDAQATVLEGAPKPPTGLGSPPETPDPVAQIGALAQAHAQVANANLHEAQAEHLRGKTALAAADHVRKTLETGHGLSIDHRKQALAERAQDHVESQPAPGAASPAGE